MTDERIKEEFEKWADNGKPSTEAERAFWQDQKDLNGRALACGFYAGFRAAERLAKIDTCEKCKYYDTDFACQSCKYGNSLPNRFEPK